METEEFYMILRHKRVVAPSTISGWRKSERMPNWAQFLKKQVEENQRLSKVNTGLRCALNEANW
ncbi:MAG: hypothetical protein ACYTEQ_22515 [Planctomycetota bacterium]